MTPRQKLWVLYPGEQGLYGGLGLAASAAQFAADLRDRLIDSGEDPDLVAASVLDEDVREGGPDEWARYKPGSVV